MYPYLPLGRTIKYVPPNNRFIIEAKKVRDTLSTDINHPTGAVVVKDGIILGKGANQSRIKNRLLQSFHKRGLCIRKILRIPSGQKYWLCPGCSLSEHHAEVQATRNALSRGNSVIGADLYLYGHWWCCKYCWDTMIETGIKDVYLVEKATDLFKK